MNKMKEYKAGLLKSPYARKMEWHLVKNVDSLPAEIYEFERIKAPNKMAAVKQLNKTYSRKYHNNIKKTPFRPNQGWY